MEMEKLSIGAWRKEKNLTQEELSLMIKVNPATVSSWETGKAKPSYGNLCKLADVFGCKINNIFLP